ncbi:ABC transporter permease [Reinekea thalattae]|uniref:ABC transporter permease n=1 Tax=Reinekea thalattae TaxID=2593301 RepID=A0A5C8ZAV4_9GAMM|nr:ABC transporter permease [Reinekea thalattae]TXR54283.1 ABC transporter permease [Reinekea thalattae]
MSAYLSIDEIKQSQRQLRLKKIKLLAFTLPLLIFILLAFVAPIGTMLYRSVYHPTVAQLIPNTLAQMQSWQATTEQLPPKDVLTVFSVELKELAESRNSGKLAEELNRAVPGSSSLIKSTARKLGRLSIEELEAGQGDPLLDSHKKWHNPELWVAMKSLGGVWTERYYLTALDLEKSVDGKIAARDTQIYLKLYWRSLRIALTITLLTALLAFPLSYYLAHCSSKKANLLMVFVLLPFWTSLLVRTTSWIALLQTNGVVNSTLQAIGLINEPLELLYTEFATVLAMTHILLPFMVLPLYSVMKNIDPSYFRAALSLGARPMPAFAKVYFPMTLPGLSAGALLVFIISIGYYITPALVGGTDGQMISNIIAFHMQSSNNWELAAALGSLLLILIIALYWLYDRFVGVSNLKLG